MLTFIAQATDVTTVPDAAAATAAGTAAVGLGVAWILFWVIFGGVGFILWLWALIDVIRREFPNPNDKILWIVLILLIAWLGPILYFIVGRKKGTIPGAK